MIMGVFPLYANCMPISISIDILNTVYYTLEAWRCYHPLPEIFCHCMSLLTAETPSRAPSTAPHPHWQAPAPESPRTSTI